MATPTTKKEPAVKHVASKHRYTEAVGRRKTAIARVRISTGDVKLSINEKEPKHYFALPRLITIAFSPN